MEDLQRPPARRPSLWQILALAALAGFILEALGPHSLKPSVISGNALANLWGLPTQRQAEIERCTLVLANLLERQTQHTERVSRQLGIAQLGLAVRSGVADIAGAHDQAARDRGRIIEEQNLAERITRLDEYIQLLETGRIHPRGEC
jgi:hypothetical protein